MFTNNITVSIKRLSSGMTCPTSISPSRFFLPWTNVPRTGRMTAPCWCRPSSLSSSTRSVVALVAFFLVRVRWSTIWWIIRSWNFVLLVLNSRFIKHQPSCSRIFFLRSPPFDWFFQSVGERLPNSLESLDHGDTPSSLWPAPALSLGSDGTLGWSKIAQDSPLFHLQVIIVF